MVKLVGTVDYSLKHPWCHTVFIDHGYNFACRDLPVSQLHQAEAKWLKFLGKKRGGNSKWTLE